MNDDNLNGQVAVVTGASRGLGRAVAVDLAAQGAFVAVNFLRNAKEAARTLEAIESAGGQGGLYAADIRKPEQVEVMFHHIYAEHRHIEILVNNAGITRDEYFAQAIERRYGGRGPGRCC